MPTYTYGAPPQRITGFTESVFRLLTCLVTVRSHPFTQLACRLHQALAHDFMLAHRCGPTLVDRLFYLLLHQMCLLYQYLHSVLKGFDPILVLET